MNSLMKIQVAAALTATVLGVGSAVALKAVSDSEVALPSSSKIFFAEGLVGRDQSAEWDCTTHSWTVKPTLTVPDRWNGEWQPATGKLSSFVWSPCTNGWSFGTLDHVLTRAKPSPPRVP